MAFLETEGLVARYGDFQALYGIDLSVDEGRTVAVIGANGAGKSTLLHSIVGLHPGAGEAVRYDGSVIGHLTAAEIVRLGIALVPEGRRLFTSLTVEENLLIGTYGARRAGRSGAWNLASVFELFPALAERRRFPASRLSGGQQQMTAFGRALMSNPRLLLCDEVSLGLSPAVVRDIYDALPTIKESGATVLLVEQDLQRALDVADHVYCLMEGRVTLEGAPETLGLADIRRAYFGM